MAAEEETGKVAGDRRLDIRCHERESVKGREHMQTQMETDSITRKMQQEWRCSGCMRRVNEEEQQGPCCRSHRKASKKGMHAVSPLLWFVLGVCVRV